MTDLTERLIALRDERDRIALLDKESSEGRDRQVRGAGCSSDEETPRDRQLTGGSLDRQGG